MAPESTETEYRHPIIDRSAARALIASRIDPEEADRDYAEWRERAGLDAE